MGGDKSAVLSNVIEELVRFRSKVRHYALALPEAADTAPVEGAAGAQGSKQEQKEKRKQLMQERKPLLEACDSLRGDLAAFGIHIKVEDSNPPCETLNHSKITHIFVLHSPSAACGVVPCSLCDCSSRRWKSSPCLAILLPSLLLPLSLVFPCKPLII